MLSDHADWQELNNAIAASEAAQIWVTHGYRDELVRWLYERGHAARSVETRFEGETGAETPESDAAVAETAEADAAGAEATSDVPAESGSDPGSRRPPGDGN